MVIEPNEAIKEASAAIWQLYSGQDITSPELEEIEISDDGKYWLVTMGFINKTSPIALIGGCSLPDRKMKRVKIDRNNGDFKGMTIREPDIG